MRWLSRRDNVLVEVPHALTLVLVLLNVAAYALCFRQSGNAVIAGDVLLRNGAMYSQAIPRGEYWRLIAYGFLHADGIHLTGNMICLMSALAAVCTIPAASLQGLLIRACAYPTALIASGATATVIATLLACRPSFVRGLTDVGFVGNSLRAERQRRSGL